MRGGGIDGGGFPHDLPSHGLSVILKVPTTIVPRREIPMTKDSILSYGILAAVVLVVLVVGIWAGGYDGDYLRADRLR